MHCPPTSFQVATGEQAIVIETRARVGTGDWQYSAEILLQRGQILIETNLEGDLPTSRSFLNGMAESLLKHFDVVPATDLVPATD